MAKKTEPKPTEPQPEKEEGIRMGELIEWQRKHPEPVKRQEYAEMDYSLED